MIAKLKKRFKGFTLVELLAVIAILAIILLIAVPQILGVIDDAKKDSFRNSVRNIFHAAELENARNQTINGTVETLDLNGETLIGTWNIANGVITISNVCNKDYKINGSLTDQQKGTVFEVIKNTEECKSIIPTPMVSGGSSTWSSSGRKYTFTPQVGIQGYEYYISNTNLVPAEDVTITGSITSNEVTIDTLGKYIYFRAVNNAGKGSWTSAQDHYVDNEKPTLTKKVERYESQFKANYPVTNLYTVSYGISGGSTVCKSGSTTVTNLNSLAAGSYTLTCTATSGTGQSVNITIPITITKTYLVDVVNVGDFVNYNTGTWQNDVPIPTVHGAFGGYTAGQSKSTSVACIGTSRYSGWRVLSKSGSGSTGIVTLVHAGTPECYYHGNNESTAPSINNLNIRAQGQYVNNTYATSARSMNCTDVQKYDSTACSTVEAIITNDLIKTGNSYWLANERVANVVRAVYNDGGVRGSYSSACGFRPVVVLKSGIEKTNGTGISTDPYQIAI